MDDFNKYLSNSSITLDIHSKYFSNTPITTEHDKHHLIDASITFEKDIEVSDHNNTTELEDNIEKNNNHLREGGIQDLITTVHFKKKGLLLKRIQELTKKIEEKYEANRTVASHTAKPIYFARDLRYEDGMSSLETSCMKAVRELCELISAHFEKEYSDGVRICDDKRDVITKEEMWRRLEELSSTFSADEVSQTILQSIVATTKSLKDLTSRVDLEADAENLKFKFEAGKLKDISCTPALLKTVRQLIEMGQISHFQRFIASEKSKNEITNMKNKLHKLNVEINSILMSKFDSRKAALIQRYFVGSQEKASALASSRYLEEELTRLRTEQAEREATVAELMENYNKIQNFDKTVQAKQSIIQKLIQVNGSAKSGHRQQHRDILCLIEEKVIKKKEEIADLCRQYRDVTSEEFNSFMKIPIKNLHCFTNFNDDCKLVREMGIHRLNPHLNNPGVESLKQVLRRLDVPIHSAPEKIISHIRDLKEMFYGSIQNVTSDKITSELEDINFKIASLKDSLHKLHKGLSNSLMPPLKESKGHTSEIMVECVKFGDCMQAWWEQPAQYVVPWVTVDGFNTQQYVEQFATQGELLKQVRAGVMQ